MLPGDTYVKGFLRTYADYLGPRRTAVPRRVQLALHRLGGDPVAQSATPRRRQRRRMESNFVVVALAGIVAVTVLVVVGLAGIGSDSEDDAASGNDDRADDHG